VPGIVASPPHSRQLPGELDGTAEDTAAGDHQAEQLGIGEGVELAFKWTSWNDTP
jgi:hypothetical protein